jgi:hypothetical protein
MIEWGGLSQDFRPLLFPEAGWIVVLLATGGLLDILTGNMGRRLKNRVPEARQKMVQVLWAISYVAGVVIGITILTMDRRLFWATAAVVVLFGLVAVFVGGRYPPFER